MSDATLLIVDDNRDNLFIMSQLIRTFLPECETICAQSAQEGLAIASRRELDGALIDVQMPDMDGLEMCSRLKGTQATGHIPVILMTAHRADATLRARGLDAGADDFISRPIDNHELMARVRVLLRVRRAEGKLREMNSRLSEMVAQKTRALREALDLAEAEREKIDTILRSVSDGLLVTDTFDQVLMMNCAAEHLLALRLCDVVGSKLSSVLGDRACAGEIMEALAQRKSGLHFDLASIQKGAARDIQGKTSLIETVDGEFRGMILTFSDVTLDRELNRMKSDFVSTAAHELRTPLTSIQGFTEYLITTEDIDAQESRKYLTYIHQNAATLGRLVRDLLDLSRLESGQPLSLERRHCLLVDLLEQSLTSYRARYPSHGFEMVLPDEMPSLDVDPGKISQVMENLLSNAVKYSPQGGQVRFAARLEGGFCLISVSDQGLGMPPEELERVFEKFYRVDNSNSAVEGTGLGLSIVKYLVEAHGGKTWMESEVGVGSTVCFTLPLSMRESFISA